MDEVKRLSPSNGRTFGRVSNFFPWSNDTSAELWHSTPLKQKNVDASLDVSQPSVPPSFKMDFTAKQWATITPPPIPADTLRPPSSQHTEFPVNDLSGSTIQRQRRELQLLMAELKDRDKELNAMAASHHKQLHAWEQDRQRVLSLEQRCARLDDELQKRNEVIRVLTKRVWVVETREEEVQKELSAARQQLCELEQKQQHISQRCEDFEEKNQSLNSTVMALSTQVGSLQVREEELSSLIKLKDKDVTEASGHIADLAGRLRDLETSLTDSRSQENKLMRDLEENKRRYREARHEVTHLKEELQQQVTQSSTQREEIIRLKQELQLLRRDLALAGEGDGWKDELLELARSKQERTVSELRCLRQVCENQRNDLQLLQLNLESSREALREKSSQGLPGSQDEFGCCCLDNPSPSSLRLKKSRPLHDAAALPAANLRGTVNSELGIFSAQFVGGGDPVSSCSLQQLLKESRQVIEASSEPSSSRPHSSVHNSGPTMSCGTTDPFYSHKCQTSHHHPATPTQACETPPKACPRHGTCQPCGLLDKD
ncbi:coiled-coil domain-containing protein 62 isoform X2 [Micropterus dolomieu]|uniref:coiled-coil domain-containing protein 62 isoform X2 n=1 Tax=Micropterus dolomieu TaxID=147949 RepID=UPI001E8E74DA|nr:coiled-coil domain-containing protein 62 isoform X2 [Micropterus dolomieu]